MQRMCAWLKCRNADFPKRKRLFISSWWLFDERIGLAGLCVYVCGVVGCFCFPFFSPLHVLRGRAERHYCARSDRLASLINLEFYLKLFGLFDFACCR
ncbi:MAG: hypothetical protein ACKERG_00800 [Candidatus Hodgkinia cicadicola]